MSEYFHYDAPNLTCVCIDEKKENGDYKGRMYQYYREGYQNFETLGSLFQDMEALFDSLNVPQASVQIRTFGHSEVTEDLQQKINVPEKRIQESIREYRGKLATLLIHVEYRQNATWQGRVMWVETGKDGSFRSELELVRLIESAVERR